MDKRSFVYLSSCYIGFLGVFYLSLPWFFRTLYICFTRKHASFSLTSHMPLCSVSCWSYLETWHGCQVSKCPQVSSITASKNLGMRRKHIYIYGCVYHKDLNTCAYYITGKVHVLVCHLELLGIET